MDDYLTLKIVAGLILLGSMFLFYYLKNIKKPELYAKVAKKYDDKRVEFFEKAKELYPSKHLVANDSEWTKVVDQQVEYLETKSKQYAIELHREYDLSETDWKQIINLSLSKVSD